MEKAFIFGKRDDDAEEFVSLDEVSAVRPKAEGVALMCEDEDGERF